MTKPNATITYRVHSAYGAQKLIGEKTVRGRVTKKRVTVTLSPTWNLVWDREKERSIGNTGGSYFFRLISYIEDKQ